MIDTNALRKKVLELAIRGKLTTQLPEDGTAEELYYEIQQEKQRLIKEGKIKKEKALPVITEDEILFDIPENWKWCRLEEICNIIMGSSPESQSLSSNSSNMEFHQGKTLFTRKVINHSNIYTSKPTKIAFPQSVIMSVRAPVGDVNITDRFLCIGRGLASIYPIDKIDLEYIFWFLSTKKTDLEKESTGSTFKAISKNNVINILIPLPPLAEQKRIVEKLDLIFSILDSIDENQKKLADNAISLKGKLIELGISGKLTEQLQADENAEELYQQVQEEKQSLIKEGKIKKEKALPKITEDEIPFDIPKNWKWVRLPEIASTMLGKTLNRSTDKGILKPYLCSINVYWSGVSLETVKEARFDEQEQKQYRLQKNDVLICEGGDVGRTIVWDFDSEMYYQNALHRVRFIGNYIMPEYFRILMKSYKDIGLIDKYSTGITIKHFVQGSLNSMPIPLPPLPEQKRIIEKLDLGLPLCDVLMGSVK